MANAAPLAHVNAHLKGDYSIMKKMPTEFRFPEYCYLKGAKLISLAMKCAQTNHDWASVIVSARYALPLASLRRLRNKDSLVQGAPPG
jgi:hypothetical protein